MSVSDPILYPIPGDSPEALRQDAVRTRADLVDTVHALSTRGRVLGVRAGTAGGLAGALAGVLIARRHRPLGLLVMAAGLVAGGYFVTRRRPSTVDSHGEPVPAALPPGPDGGDIIDTLLEQHHQVHALFADVAAARGQDKVEAFATLADFLARHEHTEQELVHPLLSEVDGNAAAARLHEESTADRALASLISRGVADPGFDAGLVDLERMVTEHASHEETEEFPLLRARVPADRLQRLATQFRSRTAAG
jgi:hypothetical protein